MDAILTSVKKLLGIEADYTHFDADVIMGVNTSLSVLTQLGVGPAGGFRITGNSETWTDFLGDAQNMEDVKSFVHLKTKLLFDPPASSAVMESANNLLAEIEWRIMAKTEG